MSRGQYIKAKRYYSSLRNGIYKNIDETNSFLKRKLAKGEISQAEFDKKFVVKQKITDYALRKTNKK